MLASVVNFFNPSLIVIGGGVAVAPSCSSPRSARPCIADRCRWRRDLRIAHSSLGGLAGVIGASAMVVDQLFSRDSIGAGSRPGDPIGAALVLAGAG